MDGINFNKSLIQVFFCFNFYRLFFFGVVFSYELLNKMDKLKNIKYV